MDSSRQDALTSARESFRETLGLNSSRSALPSGRSARSGRESSRSQSLVSGRSSARGSAREPEMGSARSDSISLSMGSARSMGSNMDSSRTWRTEDMNTGRAEGILENLKQERLNLTRRLRAVQEEIDEEDCRANRGREVVVQKVREPVLKTRKPIWLKKKKQGPRDPMNK